MMMASAARPARGGDVLAEWAHSLPRLDRRAEPGPSAVRVLRAGVDRGLAGSATSRARQLQQAVMLVAGHESWSWAPSTQHSDHSPQPCQMAGEMVGAARDSG
jgi:hypothetical protein